MSFVNVLLFAAVAIALLSTIGLVVMRTVNERLHYMGPVSTLSAFLIAAAVAIEEGLSQATAKALISVVALALMNAVLTHATARAARIRQYGNWVTQPEEREKQAGD